MKFKFSKSIAGHTYIKVIDEDCQLYGHATEDFFGAIWGIEPTDEYNLDTGIAKGSFPTFEEAKKNFIEIAKKVYDEVEFI